MRAHRLPAMSLLLGLTLALPVLADPELAARLDAWRDALSASIPEVPQDD